MSRPMRITWGLSKRATAGSPCALSSAIRKAGCIGQRLLRWDEEPSCRLSVIREKVFLFGQPTTRPSLMSESNAYSDATRFEVLDLIVTGGHIRPERAAEGDAAVYIPSPGAALPIEGTADRFTARRYNRRNVSWRVRRCGRWRRGRWCRRWRVMK